MHISSSVQIDGSNECGPVECRNQAIVSGMLLTMNTSIIRGDLAQDWILPKLMRTTIRKLHGEYIVMRALCGLHDTGE